MMRHKGLHGTNKLQIQRVRLNYSEISISFRLYYNFRSEWVDRGYMKGIPKSEYLSYDEDIEKLMKEFDKEMGWDTHDDTTF